MSSTSAPFGLRPCFLPGGSVVGAQEVGSILTGYASNIYQFSPVKIETGSATGTLQLAAVGERAIGTFLGCEFTESTGRRRVSNFWPASTAATDIVAYFTRDQKIVYEIQAGATVAQASRGNQFDWSTNGSSNGNTTTGLSTVSLNASSGAANAGLRIVGVTPGPDNAWGDTYPILQVQISEHQDTADIAAY